MAEATRGGGMMLRCKTCDTLLGSKTEIDIFNAAKKHLDERHPDIAAKFRRAGSASMIKAMFNQFFEVC